MKYNKKNNRESCFDFNALNILRYIKEILYLFLYFIIHSPYLYAMLFFVLYFFIACEPSLCYDGSYSRDMPEQESSTYVEGLEANQNNENTQHSVTQAQVTEAAGHKNISMYRRSYVEYSKYNLKG